MLAIACGLSVAAIAIALLRRLKLSLLTKILLLLSITLLTLAAGQPIWHRPIPQRIAVMVDLSPSTRTASYRDRAFLQRRLSQLLGHTRYDTLYFSDHNEHSISGNVLPDIPADRTVFDPPAEAAVILFSDGQFSLPKAAPPIYPVIDPGLIDPADASIPNLEVRNNTLLITTRNGIAARSVVLTGSATRETVAPTGEATQSIPLSQSITSASARFAGAADPWPENDALSLRLPPNLSTERWWIGQDPPDPSWKPLSANELAIDSSAYLAPSIIVLNNLSADILSTAQRDRLQQYVRDLGGAVLILGGDHAFAAGNYTGTALETLSPLASSPPAPILHWILLADCSGSMNDPAGNTTRWHLAASAILKLLPELPPDDLASVGSFAREVTWWSSSKSVRDTARLALPPADVAPNGPTELQPALASLAKQSMPTQLLVLTDAETQITDPDALATELRAKNIHLHVLAIAQGSALKSLRRIADLTGGSIVEQFEPRRWSAAVRQLMQSAMPQRLSTTDTTITFINDAKNLESHPVHPWNRTWLKPAATLLARTHGSDASQKDEPFPMAARWRVGAGEVLATAFPANAIEAHSLSALIARQPRDPRFTIRWTTGATLTVTIDSRDDRTYLNALPLTLQLLEDSPMQENFSIQNAQGAPKSKIANFRIFQTAPGHYTLTLPAPRSPSFASVVLENSTLDRIPLAARYAPEFDGIGNDDANLHELARRTGGRVIGPADTNPIVFRWPRTPTPLTPFCATAAASLLAVALLLHRISPATSKS
jgi:hypothetical protein